MQGAIYSLRSALQIIPLAGGIGAFVGIHFIRKMVPPVYFVFPVTAVTQVRV